MNRLTPSFYRRMWIFVNWVTCCSDDVIENASLSWFSAATLTFFSGYFTEGIIPTVMLKHWPQYWWLRVVRDENYCDNGLTIILMAYCEFSLTIRGTLNSGRRLSLCWWTLNLTVNAKQKTDTIAARIWFARRLLKSFDGAVSRGVSYRSEWTAVDDVIVSRRPGDRVTSARRTVTAV